MLVKTQPGGAWRNGRWEFAEVGRELRPGQNGELRPAGGGRRPTVGEQRAIRHRRGAIVDRFRELSFPALLKGSARMGFPVAFR
jgi:hypothetical protein